MTRRAGSPRPDGRSYTSVAVYLLAWCVWAGFVYMLVQHPPRKGLAWTDGLWAHVAGWGALMGMFFVGWLVPLPAPLGSGLVLLPLPDPLMQGMTNIALGVYPLVWGVYAVSGDSWGVPWCLSFVVWVLFLHLLKIHILRGSAAAALDHANASALELRKSIAAASAAGHRKPWYMQIPYLGLYFGMLATRKYRRSVEIPVPRTDGCCGKRVIAMDVWSTEHDAHDETRMTGGAASTSLMAGAESAACDGPIAGGGASAAPRGRPVFFYIHGGAWVAGHHTRNASLALLRRMTLEGWVVVSCSYRKTKWPTHVHDCAAGLQWVKDHIHLYGGDASRGVVVAGASAGGHLAVVLAALATACPERGIVASPLAHVRELLAGVKVSALQLWYPAVDPKDEMRRGAGAPWGETLYALFFRVCVGDFNALAPDAATESWDAIQPAAQLLSGKCTEFPPTLALHGTHDSVVPFAHSEDFFTHIRALRAHPYDLLLPLAYARHTFELCPSALHDTTLDVAAGWAQLFAGGAPRAS